MHWRRRLTNETQRSVEVLAADLNSKAELSRVEYTLRNDSSITTLVNNAGIGTFAPLLDSDANKMEEMISLNITALTRLTYVVRAWICCTWHRHDHKYFFHRRHCTGNRSMACMEAAKRTCLPLVFTAT